MADMEELKRQSCHLSDALIDALMRWGEINGDTDVRVPLAAIQIALITCLRQLPADKQRAYAEDFSRNLFKNVDRRAS